MRRTQEVDHEALLLSLAHSAAIDATNPARPPVREYIRNNGRSISRNRHLARKARPMELRWLACRLLARYALKLDSLPDRK
jgi:hypothetical protein